MLLVGCVVIGGPLAFLFGVPVALVLAGWHGIIARVRARWPRLPHWVI